MFKYFVLFVLGFTSINSLISTTTCFNNTIIVRETLNYKALENSINIYNLELSQSKSIIINKLKSIKPQINESTTYKKNIQLSIHNFVLSELKYAPYQDSETLSIKIKQLFELFNIKFTLFVAKELPFEFENIELTDKQITIGTNYTISKTERGYYVIIQYLFFEPKNQDKSDIDFLSEMTKIKPFKIDMTQLTSSNKKTSSSIQNKDNTNIVLIIVVVLSMIFLLAQLYMDNKLLKSRAVLEKMLLNEVVDVQEEELDNSTKNLIQKLREIATLKQSLIAIQQQHDDFIADTAHQINTPLTSILMNTDLLEMSLNQEQLTPYIVNLKASSEILNIYSNELMYIHQSTHQEYKKLLIPASIKLQAICNQFENICKSFNKEIITSIEHNLFITMNEQEFEHLIQNNFLNAIRYSNHNASIEVKLHKINPEQILLIFSSSGSALKDTDSLFESYYRENAKERGNGMGMAITKKICDKYNVQISVLREVDKNIFEYTINFTSI